MVYARVLMLAQLHSEGMPAEGMPAEGISADMLPDGLREQLLRQLWDIDISDLLYYFQEKRDSIAVNRLRTGGILSIGQLMATPTAQLKQIPYIGTSTLESARAYKQWLVKGHRIILADVNDLSKTILLPQEYSAEMPVLDALRKALVEAADIISLRSTTPRYISSPRDSAGMKFISSLLRRRFVDRLSFAEIAEEFGKTSWHITKTHSDFIGTLVSGETIYTNMRLNPELVKRIDRYRHESIFRPARLLGPVSEDDLPLLSSIGITLLPVGEGLELIIPGREKCKYSAKMRQVFRVLRETVVPMDEEEFISRIERSSEFSSPLDEKDAAFVKAIAGSRVITERCEGCVKLRMKFFVSDEQRVGRIIYDSNSWLTRRQVFERFRKVVGRESNCVNLSNLRKYGIHSSGDLWSYGKKLSPVSYFISEYAERRRIFMMEELEAALVEAGYPILDRVRSYVTENCLVDNLDPNHFCHKKYACDYSDFSWRRPGRTGLSNWILTRMRDVCQERGGVPIEEMVDAVEELGRGERFEHDLRQRIRTTLSAYNGPGQPFLADGETVRLNPEMLGKINYATIGRRGYEKTPQFEQIRTFAVEMLEHNEDDVVSLVEFMALLNEGRKEPFSRNNCMRALTNAHLGPLPLVVENIRGSLYLRRVAENARR